MNGVPAQCQAINAELDALQAEKKNLLAALDAVVGPEQWRIMRTIGNLTRRIVATSDRLDMCVRVFADPYRFDIILSDLVPGFSVSRPVTGHIWHLSPPTGQTLAESEPDQNGTCTFVHSGIPPAGSIGLSVDEDGSPIFDGPLFRSGALSRLPAASAGLQAPTVEIVAAPAVTIPPSAIALPAPLPGLWPAVRLSGPPTITLGSGALTLTAAGTVEIHDFPEPLLDVLIHFGYVVPVAPFTYTLTFDLVPSDDVNTPDHVCAVRPMGPAAVTGVTGVLNPFSAADFGPSMTNAVVASLEATFNGIIQASVAGALPLGAAVSVRRFVITATGVRFFPAVARFLP